MCKLCGLYTHSQYIHPYHKHHLSQVTAGLSVCVCVCVRAHTCVCGRVRGCGVTPILHQGVDKKRWQLDIERDMQLIVELQLSNDKCVCFSQAIFIRG